MKILALDSTAETASIAITEDLRLLALSTHNARNTHSETLLPMIVSALDCLHMSVEEIDLFACSAGPGSFTGVRIGAATIKGLAFDSGKPCIGVSSLGVLAENLSVVDGLICPVMNARRNQVYTALFSSDGTACTRCTKDDMMALADLADLLSAYDRAIYFTGDGYSLAQENIHLPTIRETPEMLRYPCALSVASLAYRQYCAAPDANYTDASLSPYYLRAPQAERERLEKRRQSN